MDVERKRQRTKEYNAAYYAANREKSNQATAAWRASNPESVRAANAAHYAVNRESAKARSAAWALANVNLAKAYRKQNAERLSARSREWEANNPERLKEQRAKWYQANRESMILRSSSRRSWVAAGDLTLDQWLGILEEFDNRCAYCNKSGKMELEHMTPRSRGGRHTASNVVPACLSCNRRKGTRTLLEFLGRSR